MTNNTTKTCTICKKTLPIESFRVRTDKKGYIESRCISCAKAQTAAWGRKHAQKVRDKVKSWSSNNPDKVKANRRKWKQRHTEKVKADAKTYRESTNARQVRQSWVQQAKAALELNPLKESILAQRRDREKERRRLCPPEKIAAYRNKNKEKHRQASREWHRKNKERNKLARQLNSKTPEGRAKLAMYCNRRMARKKLAKGKYTFSQFMQKCEYYGWNCYLCGKGLSKKNVTIDHRKPLIAGGSNWIANIAPACHSCNSTKGRRTESEFRAILAREKALHASPLVEAVNNEVGG